MDVSTPDDRNARLAAILRPALVPVNGEALTDEGLQQMVENALTVAHMFVVGFQQPDAVFLPNVIGAYLGVRACMSWVEDKLPELRGACDRIFEDMEGDITATIEARRGGRPS